MPFKVDYTRCKDCGTRMPNRNARLLYCAACVVNHPHALASRKRTVKRREAKVLVDPQHRSLLACGHLDSLLVEGRCVACEINSTNASYRLRI